MPMHRDHVLPDLCPPSVLRPNELERLQAIFRRALRAALAGALVSTGCAGEHRDPLPTTSPAGSGARPAAEGAAGAAGNTPSNPLHPAAGSAAGAPEPQAGTGAAGSGMRPPPSATAGTSGAAGMPPLPPSTRVDAMCENKQWQMLAGLTPAKKFDYATARIAFQGLGGSTVRAISGTPCANSTSMKCQSDLNQVLEGQGLDYGMSCGMVGACRYFFVTTAGDLVQRYASRQQLLEFLGEIDSPHDALLLLDYDGYTVHCVGQSVVEPSEGMWTSSVVESAGVYRATVLKLITNCPYQYARTIVAVNRRGEVKELESVPLKQFGGCAGRRPEGWVAQGAASCMSALGEHFARMAELEAASVTAFEVLAAELEHHGAPQALIDAARAAARDEIRHAQRTTELAGALGASIQPPRITPQPLRTLEQIALDNTVEGCVRETFGAAVGCYQAQAAADPRIAELMREIAADETRHATLAFELDAWLAPQLPAASRERVRSTRNAAIAALAAELHEPEESVRLLAGLPDARQAASLYSSLQRELWSAG